MSDETYWDEYSNLQFVKHKIIKEYLQGWFPKLGFWAGRILYVDTHAGRGRYSGGQEGSPLVALRTFFEHRSQDTILKRSELRLIFIENNQQNAANLDRELQAFPKRHPKISWKVYNCDSFDFLEKLADEFEKTGQTLAPSFMFIDPYGFKIPYDLLKRLKAHPRSELLVNVIWRELDMAIRNETLESAVNGLFGGSDWKRIRHIKDTNERAETAVELIKKRLEAKWATYIRMCTGGRTRYFLLHLTDSDDGCDLMKTVMWKCSPAKGYYVRKTDDPKQQYLIKPEPDLRPLKKWVVDKLSEKSYKWSELEELVRSEIWLKKHLWQIIKNLRKEGKITPIGKFTQTANPIINLM